MDKRHFLAMGALGATLPRLASAGLPQAPTGPVLLSVTGAIARTNRGPFDPAFDQMMAKQEVRFDKAFTFDFAMLARLPTHGIQPTLEYDGQPHALRGPLLADVLEAAGAETADTTRLRLRAIDGYAPTLSVSEARRLGFIVATHRDGRPMPLGGLGPLWAVFDADRASDMASRPLKERFALCPWGLYHIEVHD